MRLGAIITAVVASAVFSSTAYATSPSLLTVGAQDRHPEATFSAPGAEDATIYFATRPDRATDGRFLEENVVHLDIMTADEIQTGRWLDSAQLDPGTYYVLLRATDDDCVGDPNCLNGFSAMLTLSVSKLEQTFTGRAKAYRYLSIVDLTLRVNPLGETLRYRVCWTRVRKPWRCVRGAVEGSSWNTAASDGVTVGTRRMRRRTTFTWHVDGRRVARKPIRVPRAG